MTCYHCLHSLVGPGTCGFLLCRDMTCLCVCAVFLYLLPCLRLAEVALGYVSTQASHPFFATNGGR